MSTWVICAWAGGAASTEPSRKIKLSFPIFKVFLLRDEFETVA